MDLAIAANSNGTLLVDPLEVEGFLQKYVKRFGWPEEEQKREVRRQAVQLQHELNWPDRLYPRVKGFVDAVRGAGVAFVIYAGAPAYHSLRVYRELGLPIDDASMVEEGASRREARTLEKAREEMQRNGRNPVAYLTHDPDHARMAAQVWGKGLLVEQSIGERGPQGNLYIFDWERLTLEQTAEIVSWVKG